MKELKKVKSKKNILIRVALTFLCLYAIVMLIHVQIEISEKKSEIAEIEKQIALQQIANQKMKDALENDDPDYIEQAARNELDYAKPGEKVFVDISGD
mgnify:CR=1 FL=1